MGQERHPVQKRHQPTVQEAKSSLEDHVVDTALRAREAFGPTLDMAAMNALLEDRSLVRFPVTLAFDAARLEPGEFAWMEPLGESPSAGFRLNIHPRFEERPALLPRLIAYHLVVPNYGEIATHEEAELFGATLFGTDQESYYAQLCYAADLVA